MSKVVLDASAFLAMANREPGAEQVLPLLKQSLMSAVNVAEVLQKLVQKGMSTKKAEDYVQQFVHEIIEFDHQQAVLVAGLFQRTMPFGLSLGDRACLALGKSRGTRVLTADQKWAKLDVGISIEVIRTVTKPA